MSNVWKMIQETKGNRKAYAKSTSMFWFTVKDIKIPDIFYKIQKILGTSYAS